MQRSEISILLFPEAYTEVGTITAFNAQNIYLGILSVGDSPCPYGIWA